MLVSLSTEDLYVASQEESKLELVDSTGDFKTWYHIDGKSFADLVDLNKVKFKLAKEPKLIQYKVVPKAFVCEKLSSICILRDEVVIELPKDLLDLAMVEKNRILNYE